MNVPRINFYILLFHSCKLLFLFLFQSVVAPSENFRFGRKYFSFFHLQYFPSHSSPYFYALSTRCIVCGFSRHKTLLFSECKTAFIEFSYYVSARVSYQCQHEVSSTWGQGWEEPGHVLTRSKVQVLLAQEAHSLVLQVPALMLTADLFKKFYLE